MKLFLMKMFLPIVVIVLAIHNSKKLEVNKVPKVSSFIKKYMKVFIIVNLVMSLLMVADVTIPKKNIEGQVIRNNNELSVRFDKYEDKIRTVKEDMFSDGEIVEIVEIGLTRIFQEVFYVKSKATSNEIDFAMEDLHGYVFMIVILMLVALFSVGCKIDINNARGKMSYFMIATSNSVLFLVSILILGKLILVHVFNIIERV